MRDEPKRLLEILTEVPAEAWEVDSASVCSACRPCSQVAAVAHL